MNLEYESFTFWNKLQKNNIFHDIQIFWDAPVYTQYSCLKLQVDISQCQGYYTKKTFFILILFILFY